MNPQIRESDLAAFVRYANVELLIDVAWREEEKRGPLSPARRRALLAGRAANTRQLLRTTQNA